MIEESNLMWISIPNKEYISVRSKIPSNFEFKISVKYCFDHHIEYWLHHIWFCIRIENLMESFLRNIGIPYKEFYVTFGDLTVSSRELLIFSRHLAPR